MRSREREKKMPEIYELKIIWNHFFRSPNIEKFCYGINSIENRIEAKRKIIYVAFFSSSKTITFDVKLGEFWMNVPSLRFTHRDWYAKCLPEMRKKKESYFTDSSVPSTSVYQIWNQDHPHDASEWVEVRAFTFAHTHTEPSTLADVYMWYWYWFNFLNCFLLLLNRVTHCQQFVYL